MPLEMLLALVIGGIAGIALLLHLMGKSKRSPLTPESARSAWLRHFPDDRVHDVAVARAGYVALIETDTGRGLVWLLGADSVARRLDGARIEDRQAHLRVRFGDWSAPHVRLALTPEEKAAWMDRMERT